jgi:hypothetical protein
VHLEDVYVRPDWRTGQLRVQVTVINAASNAVAGQFQFMITPAAANESVAGMSIDQNVPPGRSQVECRLAVGQHRLWQLEDPFLYRLSTRLTARLSGDTCEQVTRFGFRELRVEKGYFRLNGKRVFLKSSHTGNHCPVRAIVPPPGSPDLLRKDLLCMKASGFNTVRFIAGIAHPYQLDLCDEIGLLVYEENLASWLLADSPKMAERFDANLREMVLRDRNHPSVVIFGLVNEMGNGPLARHAVASLDLLRALDDSRLVLQQSGRWDGQYNIGSVCNPGSTKWEYAWGVENPDYRGTAKNGPWGGYFEGAGDAHVYPSTPHTPDIEAGIRKLGHDSKPVFLSEYGIGSLMNAIREGRYYEQNGANPEYDDFKYFKQTEEKLTADWNRFGMDWDYYGPLISSRFFEGLDTPSDVAAAAFAICHSSRPDGYASGIMLGGYHLGAGWIFLNTLNVVAQVDHHPAADRLLLNLLAYAAKPTRRSLHHYPPVLTPWSRSSATNYSLMGHAARRETEDDGPRQKHRRPEDFRRISCLASLLRGHRPLWVCSLVAPSHSADSAKTAPLGIFRQALRTRCHKERDLVIGAVQIQMTIAVGITQIDDHVLDTRRIIALLGIVRVAQPRDAKPLPASGNAHHMTATPTPCDPSFNRPTVADTVT